ncbi:MAG TPA: TonB family protein [Woeseiaceae bacterium]|nr:TonB family protein [Woeseiaceae bacterium]
MALEHFKTQVLLLHSQQSTLDALSAGFGERYSVHVATSGAEALSTLGATPIHVIVSAQDLPGMSGLEALREARKRSPDTIGILLAGNDRDDGLEALVGDQEVFQIVRGAISPEALRNLIDTATKRIRLLAISESANDQAADVDEPSGEHIIMETGEHGRAIITEASASIPVLQPQRAVVTPNAAGREIDVLVLTKDEEFLQTIKESARGLHNVQYANTPSQAEALVREHKVGVLVTDAAMIGSSIEAMTERLRASRPRLVAIVAGRRDDGEMLMDLISRGQVYRFLLKPVSPGRARLAIEASVKHHLDAPDAAFAGKARNAQPAPQRAEQVRTAAPARPAAHPAARAKTAAPPAAKKAADPLRQSGRSAAPLARSGRMVAPARPIPQASGSAGGGSRLTAPKLLAAGAVALVAIGAAGWWLIGTPDAPPPEAVADTAAKVAPSIVETDISLQAAAADHVPASPSAWQAIVDEARIARDAGELIAPPESNAVELYLAARAMAPEQPVIATELDAVIEQVLAMAETALLAERTDDAAAALRMVRLANPDNPRLPFLDAQLNELELRSELAAARAAIRENRFEDAATALAAAEELAGTKTAELDLLAEELATARSEQQVDEVLTLANERLNDNALTEPSNDNARYYYELVLSSDPQNVAAQQGLAAVASKLVLRARNAIDEGRLGDAEHHLADARELDPDSSELTASVQALATARAAEAEAARQAELEAQAAARAAQEAQALAASPSGETGLAAETTPASGTATGPALAAETTPAAAAGTLDTTADDAGAGVRLAGSDAGALGLVAAPDGSTAAQSGSGDFENGMTANAGAGKTAGPAAAAANPEPEYVPISSLTRTNYVVPEYPRGAQRRNITGHVDISFTVTADGRVKNIGILDSEPGDEFDEAATEAVAQWRFEPPLENGVPVDRRVAVRLAFDLE